MASAHRARRAAAALLFAALGVLPGGSVALAATHRSDDAPPEISTGAFHCGGYRWPVKTLSDGAAGAVNLSPRDTTIGRLSSLPAHDETSGRLAPFEARTWRLRDVRLVGFEPQRDGDVHLIVADRSGRTMITELPAAACVSRAPDRLADELDAARGAFALRYGDGTGGGFHPLDATATITGVGFFDRPHDQRGAAANGVELHPLLSFTSARTA
jgi:hypothetical protein